jgi:plastocyanin
MNAAVNLLGFYPLAAIRRNMRASVLPLILVLLAALPARAADIAVSLKTSSGQPVRDAVVTFTPAGGAASPATDGRYEMVQQGIQFHPFVLIAPVGAEVRFPNHDKVRHHVYSFSPIKRFELKLYGRDETRSERFDKPGIVPLGCNIHDQMSAFIVVVDTPFAAKSDESGDVVIKGAPPGGGVLTVWHPYLKSVGNAQHLTLAVPAQGLKQSLVLELRPAPAMAMAMH